MKNLELIIVSILMFYTLQFSNHALDNNCITLYTYSEKDLENLLESERREDLWSLVKKIEIMNQCHLKNYEKFLKLAEKSPKVVDFRGYEFMSKGISPISLIAKEELNELGIETP